MKTMPRQRRSKHISSAKEIKVKGTPSAAAMPVEIGLSLPCMAEIRRWLGGEVVVEDDRLMWRPDDIDDFSEAD